MANPYMPVLLAPVCRSSSDYSLSPIVSFVLPYTHFQHSRSAGSIFGQGSGIWGLHSAKYRIGDMAAIEVLGLGIVGLRASGLRDFWF